ncbi:MAG: hypothetical protein JJ957_12280 [Pseudomonadales bacterium]|nr:hypothetical protein [Pseudomonadales bacterium]MBO6563139.1 hypothetical protein [Pseudomonadales bacterium]MBO6596912.1 hypothetical protein [Pseudomonadales bacterium]MBO6823099.1 hypothetical protein [Pseudomonadales bacterium]
MKVIGAGFGRTGTFSLKHALEQLGFKKCYHMWEVAEGHHAIWSDAHRGRSVDWPSLFDGFEATVDWPSCNFWREQAANYPDAKILLSLRDPERWYDSVMNTIYPASRQSLESDDPNTRIFGEWLFDVIWRRVFDDRMDDRAHVISTFNAHNQSVIDEVPPERLLVFEARHGWQPLCEFLEVDVPDAPYPRMNTTEEFQKVRMN